MTLEGILEEEKSNFVFNSDFFRERGSFFPLLVTSGFKMFKGGFLVQNFVRNQGICVLNGGQKLRLDAKSM